MKQHENVKLCPRICERWLCCATFLGEDGVSTVYIGEKRGLKFVVASIIYKHLLPSVPSVLPLELSQAQKGTTSFLRISSGQAGKWQLPAYYMLRNW